MAKKIKKKIEVSKIEFRLIKILQHEFQYKKPSIPYERTPGSINYHIEPNIRFKSVGNEVVVNLKVSGEVVPTKESFCHATCLFVYAVPNINDFADIIDNKDIKFRDKIHQDGFITSLIGISYSTMRGILMEKGSGTILQTEFLPLMDPRIFIKG